MPTEESSVEPSELGAEARTNVTLTIRDDDTGNEEQTKLAIFTDERNCILKAVDKMIVELGVIDGKGS